MAAHNREIIAGIDLAAGRGITEVALLELTDEMALPRYQSQSHRAATTDEVIVAMLVDAQPTVIAIDAPLSLPAPVAAAIRGNAPSVGASGGRPLVAVSDGTSSVGAFRERPPAAMTTASPYTRTAERDPLWSTLGLRPLPVSFLGGLTFRALVLVPKLRCALPDTAIIEVFPTATLRLLGVRPVVPGAKRAAKTSEAARRATQDGLARYVAGIPAVEEELLGADLLDADLLGADLLDALAAALTGVAYSRREFVAVGEPDEGQIVVPSRAFASTLAARAGERSMNDRQLAVIGEVVAIAGALGIDCWLRGGWAVDFALGRVTREHRDIDIFAWGKDIVRLAPALEHAGFEPQAGPPPDAQRDYIKDGEDVQITLLEANERGEVATAGGPFKGVAWPQGMLGSQFGRIGDVTCRIVDPRVQIEIKESWRTWRPDLPPREKDAADIARLREALA